MRGLKMKWLVLATVVALAAGGSCTNNDLDNAGSADVILEVVSVDSPPVTAQRSTSTNGQCSLSATLCSSNADCPITETCLRQDVCMLEVEEWSATFRNQPKNTLGIGTYNDVVLISVDISYAWVDGLIFTAPTTVGLGNIVVPAEGSASVDFFPISTDALGSNAAIEGATANLTLTVNARTVEGTTIRQTLLLQLQVEVCN